MKDCTFHAKTLGLSSPHDLPLIDVRGLRSSCVGLRNGVAMSLGEAARDIGFFRITGHEIDTQLIARTYDMSRRFFSLPEEWKLKYYIGLSKNHRGYVPFSEKGNYDDEKHRSYEAFDLALDLPSNDPDYLAGNRLLGPNVWPELDGFRTTISEYYNAVSWLGLQICSALETFLGLHSGSITELMSKPISQLRLMHYVRGTEVNESRTVNMGAHTDYECLTLLHTHNPGLQIMNADGAWIDVPVDPSTFVVNIGDMLEAWSNGIFRSTPHRVLNLSPERYSLPYFVAANHDTIIEPFPELVRSTGAKNYPAFRAGEHLERMLMRDFPYLRTEENSKEPNEAIVNPFEARLKRSPYT